MPQSDLAKMIENTDGKIALGAGIDYSGVFEVLGTELEPRIRNIGSAPSSLSDGASLTYNNSSVSGIDFSLIGEWGNNPQFKLVRLRLSAFGGVPFTRDEKTYVASDKNNPQLNNTSYNAGYIFPNDLESSNLEALGNRQGGALGGICVNCSMGQEWLSRAFQNNSTFSVSNNGTEFQTLVDKRLIHAEIIFKMGTSDGKRVIMPVIMGDRITDNDMFRASIAAMNCTDQDIQQGGLKLFDDDKQQILGDNTPVAISSAFDNKTGAFKSVTIDKIKALDNENFAGSIQYQSTAASVFVRFFIMKENYDAACSATSKKFPEDIMKVNGEEGVGLTFSSYDPSNNPTYSGQTLNELINEYASKPIIFTGPKYDYVQRMNVRKSDRSKIVYQNVIVPWPVFVRPSNGMDSYTLASSYAGVKALFNGGDRVASRVKNRQLSKEEIDEIISEYKEKGPVVIKMNSIIADRVQDAFYDIANYYGENIIIAAPSLTVITSVKRNKGNTSAHNVACAIDFDYGGEINSASISHSDLWNHRNDTTKAVLEIMKYHGAIWGGDSSKFYLNSQYDPMHFQWL